MAGRFALIETVLRAEDDAQLLRKVALGDVEALREVYARCSSRAFAVILRLLRSHSDSEDVLQETFLQLWRNARSFDPSRGGMEAWVVTVARTRAIDRLRQRAVVDRTVEGASQEDQREPPVSPFDALRQRQNEGRVAEAMAGLTPDQRTVIQLAYFEGLSQSEISERTGTPLGTVKTRTRLALEKLGEQLGESENEEDRE